jgi:hypothetical protein
LPMPESKAEVVPNLDRAKHRHLLDCPGPLVTTSVRPKGSADLPPPAERGLSQRESFALVAFRGANGAVGAESRRSRRGAPASFARRGDAARLSLDRLTIREHRRHEPFGTSAAVSSAGSYWQQPES